MANLTTFVLPNVLSGLLATSVADLDPYWTQDQLYAFMDEELKRLARAAAVNVDRGFVSFAAQQPFVYCGASHLATYMVDLNGPILRSRTIQQLQALDADWQNSTKPVTAYTIGADGADTIRLYGIPQAPLFPWLTSQLQCPAVDSADTNTPLSPLLDDVCALRAIAEAKRAETDAQMPEAVAFCEQLIALYHQAAKTYFGEGM